MTMRFEFAPAVLAFFAGSPAAAQAVMAGQGRRVLVLDGARCPTPQDFAQQLAQTVHFAGTDLSLNSLGQALSHLDWLGAPAFGICVENAEQMFARGNPYMWQYLLEMAHNIERNVQDFRRPSIRWLLLAGHDDGERLRAFFAAELGMAVAWADGGGPG